MGYATDGHRTDVRVQKNQRVIRQMNLNGWQAVIIQTETVSEETWVGLSKVEAESFCVASESSTLNGSTRPYLGGCTVSNTTPFESSIYATACWGTRVQS